MALPKVLIYTTITLLCCIAFVAIFKGKKNAKIESKITPIEVTLEQPLKPALAHSTFSKPEEHKEPLAVTSPRAPEVEVNRIEELFTLDGVKSPIVETITYKSHVDWQKGRQAWLADYAKHYQTSRHFIARSLNRAPDYFKQDIAEGDQFNVLRKDVQFYLLVDLSLCKMKLYYDMPPNKEKVLLKTYLVGLGRMDPAKLSGCLTPTGKYSLGNKIAIYKPKMMGYYNGSQIEMISVFGTRWIPFDKELGACSAPAKGLGIHGLPWILSATGEKVQDHNSLGKYLSDGCIRLASEDMEELFSIIITKPTVIELIK